jgi:hypothetical protein
VWRDRWFIDSGGAFFISRQERDKTIPLPHLDIVAGYSSQRLLDGFLIVHALDIFRVDSVAVIATPKRQQNTNPGAVVWEPSRKTARNHRIAFLKTETGTLEPFYHFHVRGT